MISLKSFFLRFFYKNILKNIFFVLNPENVHDKIIKVGVHLGRKKIGRSFIKLLFYFEDKSLKQNILGINFKNPIGLAAGFDKNADLVQILPSVGFGFEEVGSVTGEYCAGNPRPRLWRLLKSKSLLVYYGLKNDGAEVIAKKLNGQTFAFPVGISIAKTNNKNTVDEQAGIADYKKAHAEFMKNGIGDYFTINISCPNAFGGEPFSDPLKLDRLLSALDLFLCSKPVFLKMPAELSEKQIDEIILIARKYKISGFISTNLAKNRDNANLHESNLPKMGGMSGKVVEDLANQQIAYIYKKTRGEFILIGCGGVFSGADAYKKIKLGASLIQLITGMIYEGPQLIGDINRSLVFLLKKDGYKNISEAVGVDVV